MDKKSIRLVVALVVIGFAIIVLTYLLPSLYANETLIAFLQNTLIVGL